VLVPSEEDGVFVVVVPVAGGLVVALAEGDAVAGGLVPVGAVVVRVAGELVAGEVVLAGGVVVVADAVVAGAVVLADGDAEVRVALVAVLLAELLAAGGLVDGATTTGAFALAGFESWWFARVIAKGITIAATSARPHNAHGLQRFRLRGGPVDPPGGTCCLPRREGGRLDRSAPSTEIVAPAGASGRERHESFPGHGRGPDLRRDPGHGHPR